MHEFTGSVKAVGEDCPQETLAKRFEALLRQTGRRGIENVLEELRALGFFSAPASARFHGNYPEGLLEHSLNVYDEAMLVRDAQLGLKPDIAALRELFNGIKMVK